jgi:DNA-binding response OmpR family regulator
MEKIILLMDNDTEFLKSLSQELRQAGYIVREASTIEKAEAVLCRDRIHLAIMDIEMRNKNPKGQTEDGASSPRYDNTDISGLILAKDPRFRFLPKIILTEFPKLEYVRTALGPVVQGPSPAVGFIAKSEGNLKLIHTVDEAFASYVKLNWNLVIQFDETTPTSLLHIAEAMEPDSKDENLLSRAAEIEDLFRALFYGATEGRVERIKIQRLLWKRGARIALLVFVFPKNKPVESRIIVCGRNALIMSELSLYTEHSPRTHKSGSTLLQNCGQTVHFAGLSYTPGDASLENVQTLAELYKGTSDKIVGSALKSLYEQALPEWHKNYPSLADENERLDEVYRERLNLTEESIPQQRFAALVQAIARQAHTLGVKIESSQRRLLITFGSQTFSYPDPTFSLWGSFDIGRPVLLSNSPGKISVHNLLSENGERVWITDFAAAGPAPVLWNYLTLEAEFRFDLVEPTSLQWLHQMETYLTGDNLYRFEIGDLEAPLRKPMKAIQMIRKLGSKDLGNDAPAYHLGLLFEAFRRLSEFNTDNRLTRGELTRYTHLLIGAAVILGRIGDGGELASAASQAKYYGISIDKENRIVRVDGARVPMRGQSYYLLCYLFDHVDRLTTRRELVEMVLGEKYDAADESQAGRLNTAMHRLREKIEIDYERPRYLLTEPGGGYRLHSEAQP